MPKEGEGSASSTEDSGLQVDLRVQVSVPHPGVPTKACCCFYLILGDAQPLANAGGNARGITTS